MTQMNPPATDSRDMNASPKSRFRSVCAYAGWVAFFSPAAFIFGFLVSVCRDHRGPVMAVIGRLALYVTFALPIVSFVAAIVALVGAEIYKDRKLRVQGLVGALGIFCLIRSRYLRAS